MSEAILADELSNLITIDRDYLARIEERRRLLRIHGTRLHTCLPSGEAAVHELYCFLMKDYLPRRYPTIFTLDSDDKTLHNAVTEKSHPTVPRSGDMEAALRVLGETVEEDMFLLHETPEGHFSDAFICCFAAGFDPSKKVGRLLREIHAPVPSYEKIGSSMEKFFSRLAVGRNVKRMNVSLPTNRFPPARHEAASLTILSQWAIQTHDNLLALGGNHITEEDQSLMQRDDFRIENVSWGLEQLRDHRAVN